MNHVAKMAQIARSSGRLFHALLHVPSVRHCFESTSRLLMTNVIVLRETEKALLRRFLTRYASKCRNVQRMLMGACLFSWAEDRISDEEMNNSLSLIFDVPSTPRKNNCHLESQHEDRVQSSKSDCSTEVNEVVTMPLEAERWEEIVTNPDIRVWRRPFDVGADDRELFEYRVHGRFTDVPARAFLAVQLDLQYRRYWDNKVVRLEIVDEKKDCDTELVHWVTKFPYPMANREYIYARRCHIDATSNCAVIVARSLPEHPLVPDDSSVVRVTRYESIMVIKAHDDFDSNGFDYYMKYHDDPKASFPSFAYKWMATHGLPGFLEEVHRAAVVLHAEQTRDSNAYS